MRASCDELSCVVFILFLPVYRQLFRSTLPCPLVLVASTPRIRNDILILILQPAESTLPHVCAIHRCPPQRQGLYAGD